MLQQNAGMTAETAPDASGTTAEARHGRLHAAGSTQTAAAVREFGYLNRKRRRQPCAAADAAFHPAMRDPEQPIPVSTLTKAIAQTLEEFGQLSVSGELSQAKVAPSGHLYATLKDAEAVISLVMWRSSVVRSFPLPVDGQQVIARGTLSVYGPRGQYQLVVTKLTVAGAGDLAARFAALKAKLTAEGLFDDTHKIELPRLPRAVGLATATGSAALADLLHSIRARFPAMPIVHAPCVVQGAAAPRAIVAALRALDRHPLVDVIVVGRGGGSLEDLWAFNDEAVVRAIHACVKPVVSAVGHETDTTLADFVADVRAKTPTAAGELVVPVASELYDGLDGWREMLDNAIDGLLDRARTRLSALASHRALATPKHQLAFRRQHLDDLAARLVSAAHARLDLGRQRLSAGAAHLDALSPLAVIGRGYSVLRSAADGALVRSIRQLPEGAEVHARLPDGWLRAEIIGIRAQRLREPEEEGYRG